MTDTLINTVTLSDGAEAGSIVLGPNQYGKAEVRVV